MNENRKILSDNLFPVVGIGASAGGLEAFRNFIRAIPDQSGMAYVLVQHLDPNHESLLPDLLQRVTNIPVLEIADDVKVQPDHIYILPSNKMLVANDGVLQLSPRTTKKGELNLPIDLFFTSLAAIHHSHAIGIVLSGTGSDGTNGLKAIRDNEGITFAQDEASATYPGMPRSAVLAEVVDFVMPPGEMPKKLQEVAHIINRVAVKSVSMPSGGEVFGQILSLLRARRKTDFTYYKQTTIRRRILRRMAISKTETPAHYLQYLRENPPEQDALYQDLLISVTSFFRDNPVFDALCESILPHITQKTANKPIRVWVAGCSTGEEAYSIAICLSEYLGDQSDRVQIFASDLSEQAIAKARTGLYTKADVSGVSAKRLQEFFTKTQGGYHINKSVRAMCVFASHNFLTDPPFSKLDFISCRNVLIYMSTYLQKKVLTSFHYALNPGGFLLLGKSETSGGVPDLFATVAKNEKLFSRKDTPTRFIPVARGRQELPPQPTRPNPEAKPMQTDFQKTADDIILGNYSPVGVIVDESLDIVHFRGNTANYLEQSSGKPTHNLLLMAKKGLAFELRNMLHKVKKEKAPVTKENIPVDVNGSLTNMTIEAIPLPNTIEPHYLVLFHNSPTMGSKSAGKNRKPTSSSLGKDDKDQRILQLEQELMQLRDDMRGITEDQEAVNEELQSANEELLSGNEELQSLNEEVESSKEELQSTNEELTVVNQEMASLNEQVTAARDYAEAIIANIREPLLVLNSNLRIKLANQSFYKTFRVGEAETEGMLVYDLGNRQWNIPQLRTLLEHILPEKSTFNDFEITHHFADIGERVMLLNAREIMNKKSADRLILLSIEDITEAAKAREAERQATKRFQFIADSLPQKVWTADALGNVDYYNQSWFDYTGLSFDELKDWGWEKNVYPDDRKETKERWQQSIASGTDFEIEHRFLNAVGDYRWHLSRAIAYKDKSGSITMWIGTNTEIHEQKAQKEVLEQAVASRTHELRLANETLGGKNDELKKVNKELESFTYVSSHDLQEPLRKIQTLANSILEKENRALSDSGKDAFRRMQQSAERMQRLIQDLLAFSRLSSHELTREPIELSLLVSEVVSELRESIEEKQAIIDATDLCPVNVVVFQFRQLLTNLIGNALKFSYPARPPHIRISCVVVNGSDAANDLLLPNTSYYQLAVADNGIGFDSKYNDKIFDVFQRLHRKEQYDGTGIGLSIVKKIVENHNGFIIVTSELDKGARFDIYIPTVEDAQS